jgi:hypothetical protein
MAIRVSRRAIAHVDGECWCPGSPRCDVGGFWSWAYSDVLSNVNRSIFAEFLVASALELTHEPRVEWDAVDLRYHGHGIEVRSAA